MENIDTMVHTAAADPTGVDIGIDPFNEGCRNIGHPAAGDAGLAVEYPIVLKAPCFGQILRREMVPLGDEVVVARIAADLEHTLHRQYSAFLT